LEERRAAQLLELLSRLGLPQPNNLYLYDLALTHSSFTYEFNESPLENYERLEFLGDAVLKLIVSEYLFERFPDYREGDLTKIRAVIVSDAFLSTLAQSLDLASSLVMGTGEMRSGGLKKPSNLACAFEALLGALFLDGQMHAARTWIRALMEDPITHVDLDKLKDNFKAALQEFTQSEGIGLPNYRTVHESGPAHRRTFTVEVLVNDEMVGYGTGRSKKEAQQQAAKMALRVLATDNDVYTPPSDGEQAT
jgi:ribonuclease-3